MTFLKTDLTTKTDLQDHGLGTGAIRNKRPLYVDFFPPCNNACPAGENIQSWLALAQEGKNFEAWLKLTEENPMPDWRSYASARTVFHATAPCDGSCAG